MFSNPIDKINLIVYPQVNDKHVTISHMVFTSFEHNSKKR
jgi:hypothetical protein